MKRLVLAVIGEDKTGLVESLSKAVLANQGNWKASSLSHLSGYFAGVVEVEVDNEHLSSLSNAVTTILGLTVKVHQVDLVCNDNMSHLSEQQVDLVITGNDRKGIVQELASIISHRGASISQFSSSTTSAPNWGGEIFHAIAKVQLPVGMEVDEVVEALELVASDIMIDW